MECSADLYISKVAAGDDSDRCIAPDSEQDNVAIEEEVVVSNPSQESGETQLVSSHLIDEVDGFRIASSVCNEEREKAKEEEEMLSAEELYEKSEMFIGNFYRELKLQQIE
ncbi:uncharacterized protein LOC131048288 [Cryptomeria japonica]|uniref:uncharacterized protein LOC131048288 n=1 Tax=Cryptomeria japonica TaxID=3369 RepID=UPI0027D9EBD2|nr:uncharacterized protein LOC131048288 [Cryptomeria japonica]